VLPDERPAWARVEGIARDLSRRYGYREIETPLFEQSEVFERGVGATTDVVQKELFRVAPGRGEERERWALRPEATAGIVRAYVQHGMHTLAQPVRLTLTGAMFRYDRPQAGRYRQFWQWDVEAIGDPGPGIDAEIVELCATFYATVGVEIDLFLNSIGDTVCRPAYVDRLREHFAPHVAALGETDRARLETNPLRLLDSKEPALAMLVASAPSIADSLCDACRDHFAGVRRHLDALGVRYVLEPRLVRGLDYYTRTTFEVYPRDERGQQDALGGGGRYDGLVQLLGGKPTPGIGFALGIDRTVLALERRGGGMAAVDAPTAVVVGADAADTATRLVLATELRAAGIAARADLASRKLGRQLEGAAREGAHFAVIVGDELASGQLQIKDLQAGTQRAVARADVARELARAHASHRHG
jgi:histidyl-tRNA synthetase